MTYLGVFQQRWIPEKDNILISEGIKIDSYACKKCGFIESYLQIEKDAETSSA